MSDGTSTRLKSLLQQRLWHGYSTFCAEYDRTAKAIDPQLVGGFPSRAQFHRWLSGTVKNLPYAHHRAVLESMFPDWTVEQLFAVPDDGSESPASRPLPRREIPGFLDLVDAGLKSPDGPLPCWGPVKPITTPGTPSLHSRPSPISAYSPEGMDDVTRQLGRKLVELSRLMRLTESQVRQLANLAGHVVELELILDIDIDRDGKARVLYQHDLMNLSDKPLSRMPREIWFQYVHGPLTIVPTQHNDRQILIQRIHDAGSLAKFAFKISPPLQPGERTVVRYVCEGGLFRDELYWRQVMPRYTRHFTFTVRHQGIGRLSECGASIEYPEGSETSVTEGLLWDCDGGDVTITLAADYLRPAQAVELRWDIDRAA